MKTLISLLLLCLGCSLAHAEVTCNESDWPVAHKTTKKGTELFIYKTTSLDRLSSSNLACVVGLVFFDRVKDFPEKAVVALIDESYERGLILRWSLAENFLLVIEVNYLDDYGRGEGHYTKYPEPLKRIKEILINKPFPTTEELSLLNKRKIDTKHFPVDVRRLKMLIGGY